MAWVPGELLGRYVVAGREVSVNVCGVTETMLQGSSRVPPPSIGKQ
jgi:hypothetical protein